MAAGIYHWRFFLFFLRYLPVDKIYGLCFELLGTVQVCKDEGVGHILH